MQFRDGQLLTADDINKYLVNREGSLDTSLQTTQNKQYASDIQAAQTRLDKISGTVINFPGYSTNIVEIPLTFYQSPTHAGNATGTEGWQEIYNKVKSKGKYGTFINSTDNIVSFTFDKSKLKSISNLLKTQTEKIFRLTPWDINQFKAPAFDHFGSINEDYEYENYSGSPFYPINSECYYTTEPLESAATVFKVYVFVPLNQNELPLILAEVTA